MNFDEKKLIVSRDTAIGYIANQKKTYKYLGVGLMFWTLAGVPYTLLCEYPIWCFLGMAVCMIIGIIFMVIGLHTEQNKYRILRKNSLTFDFDYYKELSNMYNNIKSKYILFSVLSAALFLCGIFVLVSAFKEQFALEEYHAIVFVNIAVGILGLTYFWGVREAYELLVNNEKYVSRCLFKINCK